MRFLWQFCCKFNYTKTNFVTVTPRVYFFDLKMYSAIFGYKTKLFEQEIILYEHFFFEWFFRQYVATFLGHGGSKEKEKQLWKTVVFWRLVFATKKL